MACPPEAVLLGRRGVEGVTRAGTKEKGGLGSPSALCGNFSWRGSVSCRSDGSLWRNLNSAHQWAAGLELIHVLLLHYMPPSS